MFKFLKEKLSTVVKKFSKEVEEEAEVIEKTEAPQKTSTKKAEQNTKTQLKLDEKPIIDDAKKDKPISKREIIDESKSDVPIIKTMDKKSKEKAVPAEAQVEREEKKGFLSKIFHKKEEPKQEAPDENLGEEKKEVPKAEEKQKKAEKESEKKGIIGKVSDVFTKVQLSEEKFDELFWDIELALLESNVAVQVIDLIKKNLKEELTTGKLSRKQVNEIIVDTLKQSLDEVLSVKTIDLEKEIARKKPYVIAVIGVNGSGKTTAIAKLANRLQSKGHSVVLAAADTFRAAAIHQIEEHANKLGIKLIKHDYNSDPAAVAFDAVKHAQSKGIDVVLIDTAGRMHSNDNLMQELKKLIRVNNPDMKLFVGESITGNDCVEQATKYNEEVGIDAIILTKADVDEKGGAAISISHVTGKPILFIGTGQTYEDLEPFDKKKILANVGL